MRAINVIAPARLHLGFVGLFGASAKEYGAVGLAINTPCVRLRVSEANQWIVEGAKSEKIAQYINTLNSLQSNVQPLKVELIELIPSHVGLGSGTQLALSFASAYTKLINVTLSIEKLSGILDRGKRSGIGTAAFATGGFLVDKDPAVINESRAISARLDFPQQWRILLVMDDALKGTHGSTENAAFRELGGFSSSLCIHLQKILRQQVIPALKAENICEFGNGITRIQNEVGDFFQPVQGGRYLSSKVSRILNQSLKLGAYGVGQSSWGPTGFILARNESQAQQLKSRLLEQNSEKTLNIKVVQARNKGAKISITDTAN